MGSYACLAHQGNMQRMFFYLAYLPLATSGLLLLTQSLS